MTVKEIKEDKEWLEDFIRAFGYNFDDLELRSFDEIVVCLEELQRYKELGTVEELRVARDKQIPKKPNKTIDSTWGIKREVHVCPVCDYYLLETHFIVGDEIKERKMVTFCDTCGQAIDWEEV